MQDLLDKELLKFESQEEKPNVMQNPLPAHGNNGAGPSSNAISLPERGFDPSQLITRPGTKVRVWFETDRVLPEIAMIARGNPTKSAGKKVASTEGGSTQAAMPSQARPIVRIKGPRKFAPLPFLQSQLLPDWISAGLITPVPPKAPPSPLPTWYDPNARCEYHMQGRRHWTYDCYDLKHKIQDLIEMHLFIRITFFLLFNIKLSHAFRWSTTNHSSL